jgi:ATP-dependent Clp protease ATP-binding subunit ClpC
VNGYNFTERVRMALAKARDEAARLHHDYVGTEHILLGLVREGGGVAGQVLEDAKVDARALARRVEDIVVPGPATAQPRSDLPYTARAKHVLELAMNEARDLDHGYVGTEHVLLGLIREGKGIAAQILRDVGVDLERARSAVLQILNTAGPPPRAPATDTQLADMVGMTPERVEVVLHFGDGRRFQGVFESPMDAVGFLRWVGRDRQP